MASVIYGKEQFLFQEGESVSSLFLILKGSVRIILPEGEYLLSKGDVAGILDIYGSTCHTACQAAEESSVFVYPVNGVESLLSLFKDHPDYCGIFLRSAFKQITLLFQKLELAKISRDALQTGFEKNYAVYLSLCKKHQIHAREIPTPESLPQGFEDTFIAPWRALYYDGFYNLLSSGGTTALSSEAAVPAGLIAETGQTFDRLIVALRSEDERRTQLLSLYMDTSLDDLFDVCTELYLQLPPESQDARDVYQVITGMISLFDHCPGENAAFYQERIEDFNSCVTSLEPEGSQDTVAENGAARQTVSLKGSLQTILSYSQGETEFCSAFKEAIDKYVKTPDKNSVDDATRMLRNKITSMFYELYRLVFFRAVKDEDIPMPVRMFLYFGYVDETLAGADNAAYLCDLAGRLKDSECVSVYTLFDWLKAIYEGKKEPSRNEFDQDYADMLHSQRISGKISAAEEAELLKNGEKKVENELTNMVPSVNKITFGRISTFCPVFSGHNVLRPLTDAFVSFGSAAQALSDIAKADYTAFGREYLYDDPSAGIQKEYFHMEVMPDVILMPCIGTRGVMWQEIEGKRRTTPARMLLPVFYLEDLHQVLIRLTGEYRWEMCKRIQGARWNDISERSLTSEYFDYIQFYKKNHELSADVKDRLRNALQKVHNSFKEMFIADYVTYITYEANGSPRLTKPARNILFTHCPLSADCRKTLASNPLYKEILDRYEIKKSQQLRKLGLIEKRILANGGTIPEELAWENEYLNR